MTDEKSDRPTDLELAQADVDLAIKKENWAGALFRLVDYLWAITKESKTTSMQITCTRELAKQLEMAVGLKAALVTGASLDDVARKRVLRTARLARRVAAKDKEVRPN